MYPGVTSFVAGMVMFRRGGERSGRERNCQSARTKRGVMRSTRVYIRGDFMTSVCTWVVWPRSRPEF